MNFMPMPVFLGGGGVNLFWWGTLLMFYLLGSGVWLVSGILALLVGMDDDDRSFGKALIKTFPVWPLALVAAIIAKWRARP